MQRDSQATSNGGKPNTTALRAVSGIGALLCTAFVAWNLAQFASAPAEYVLYVLLIVPAAVVAIFGWWLALDGAREETRIVVRKGFLGGVVLGTIMLVLGFVGPMILSPQANQGPLLGLLITGPIGFVVGAAMTTLIVLIRRRSASATLTHR